MNNFDNLIKNKDLLRGIYNYNYIYPYDVHTKSILSVNKKKNTIVVSKKGKTSSLIISLLSMNDIRNAIIITDNNYSLKELKHMIIEISKYMKIKSTGNVTITDPAIRY